MEAVPRRLREELAKLDMRLNEEKSRIVDLSRGESFRFLGFDFRRVSTAVRAFRCTEALRTAGWNRGRAAELLGISKETLRYRIEKFELRP